MTKPRSLSAPPGPGGEILPADGEGDAAAAVQLPPGDRSPAQGAAHCSQAHLDHRPPQPYVDVGLQTASDL